MNVGYAQEIITPPVGVDMAGYFNERLNQGMYDDLYVKVVAMECNGTKCAIMAFDLCSIVGDLFDAIYARIDAELGQDIRMNTIVCADHTHTGPRFWETAEKRNDVTKYAFDQTVDAAIRALKRAFMNLLPAELQAGSVYNNPYGFVRRYWMKNGVIITNPGWCNPDIDRPEGDYDRTIGILKIMQGGRLAALVCNIVNHGDTIGGNIISADWYGRFAQEIQHELKTSLPVIVLDDASGDINHFDFHQKINQTSYAEAVRIGRGYARIVLDALDSCTPIEANEITVANTVFDIPHRKITPEELADAKYKLATVPDIPKEGDFESQDLANGVPAAVRYFAQRVINCHEQSVPSHQGRVTAIRVGKDLAFVSLPGEPFNGIGRAIRQASPYKNTFIASLAQSVSGYVPMPECFERGGYEVQAEVNSSAQNAATVIIDASIKNLLKD